MPREPWFESNNPDRLARSAGWRLGVWIVVGVVFFGLLGAGIWAVRVATSDVKGAGETTQRVNDATNRINSQEWFHGQYAQILTADRNLDEAAANLKANPVGTGNHDFHQTNYTGLKNRCVEMVNAYNAEALKVTRAKWLDPALPQRIDETDPKTDCKENTR